MALAPTPKRSQLGDRGGADSRAIAFGFSDLSVAVIPAEAGIQGRVTGFGTLDSRFRGNDRGEKGNSLANCDCPGADSGALAGMQIRAQQWL
jgi:hypothetical protein